MLSVEAHRALNAIRDNATSSDLRILARIVETLATQNMVIIRLIQEIAEKAGVKVTVEYPPEPPECSRIP
jgi:hypothetical protein